MDEIDTDTVLTCFKAYDVRGELGVNFNAAIAYRIGRAVAQALKATNIVIGYDTRETSPELAAAVTRGICDAGANVMSIGLAGTEEMYCAVSEFKACAGIEITASHNPINYNGLKIVKSGSKPLDGRSDFLAIKILAESQNWVENLSRGSIQDIAKEARKKYVYRVLNFFNNSNLKQLKIVIVVFLMSRFVLFGSHFQNLKQLKIVICFVLISRFVFRLTSPNTQQQLKLVFRCF